MKNFKSTIILLLLMSFSFINGQAAAGAQDYTKTLSQVVKELNQSTNKEAYEKVIYKFERLNTLKNGKDWILLYNIAYCKIVLSRWKKGNEAAADLEEAVANLQKASKLNPNNSEILTLESRALISLIGTNATKFGPKYTGTVKSNLNKALSLDKNNPRAYLVYGMYYVYFPKIAGGDIEKGCDIFQQAANLYNAVKPDPDSVKPQWGKELNEWYIKNSCNKE